MVIAICNLKTEVVDSQVIVLVVEVIVIVNVIDLK